MSVLPRHPWWTASAIAAAGLALRLLLAPSLGYLGVDGDLIEHKQAVHRALTQGLHEVYANNPTADPALTGRPWNGDYFFNNLPVILYVRCLLGAAYRWIDPKGFDLWSSDLNYFELERTDLRARLAATRGLTIVLKLPGILADSFLVLAIFAMGRGSRPDGLGLLAAAAYAFNPGVVLNTAFWGQHDPVWIALVMLSLAWLRSGRVEAAWSAYALAALTKPQAWAFAPLVLLVTIIWYPWRRRLLAVAAGSATASVVFLPFVLHGTWRSSLPAILQSTIGGEPFVSCNALNLWWLVTAGRGYEVSDAAALVGPFSARAVGIALVLIVNTAVLWPRGIRQRVPTAFPMVAALVYLGFFTFATELHENHLVAALALLAAGVGKERCPWAVLGALSVVLLVNIVAFDPALSGRFEALIPAGRALTMAVSMISVAAFVGLCWCTRCGRALGEADRKEEAC